VFGIRLNKVPVTLTGEPGESACEKINEPIGIGKESACKSARATHGPVGGGINPEIGFGY